MNFIQARKNMVESQILPNRVTEARILSAFRQVPREAFVPEKMEPFAYSDQTLMIAPHRFMLAPLTQARLINAASLGEEDRVLCLPSGSGYLCAILGLLVKQVYGIDTHKDLVKKSTENLDKLGITNVHIQTQKSLTPPPSMGLFNAIIIEGAIEETPTELFTLLSEGGHLLSVLAGKDNLGHITHWKKINGQIGHQFLNETPQYVLPEFSSQKAFLFA
jgi:protein-L-isoaspartate(D-aspartate) O-methyltransferase